MDQTRIEMKELESKIRNQLAQEHNWGKQQDNWEAQQKHWKWIITAGVVVALLTFAAKIYQIKQAADIANAAAGGA